MKSGNKKRSEENSMHLVIKPKKGCRLRQLEVRVCETLYLAKNSVVRVEPLNSKIQFEVAKEISFGTMKKIQAIEEVQSVTQDLTPTTV